MRVFRIEPIVTIRLSRAEALRIAANMAKHHKPMVVTSDRQPKRPRKMEPKGWAYRPDRQDPSCVMPAYQRVLWK